MPEKRKTFSPCSERDIRAAALKATHERIKEMDRRRQPTVSKFGDILREEQAKFRAFGEHMAEKTTCPIMTWEELKQATEKFTEGLKNSKGD